MVRSWAVNPHPLPRNSCVGFVNHEAPQVLPCTPPRWEISARKSRMWRVLENSASPIPPGSCVPHVPVSLSVPGVVETAFARTPSRLSRLLRVEQISAWSKLWNSPFPWIGRSALCPTSGHPELGRTKPQNCRPAEPSECRSNANRPPSTVQASRPYVVYTRSMAIVVSENTAGRFCSSCS